MPVYNPSPFAQQPTVLLQGQPVYVWGSFNDRVSPSKMGVSQVALTTNVATLTVQVYEGNIPIVGQLITVTGTQTNAGAFNVVNVALTAVSINATSGAGTVSFALTHANVGTTADTGLAIAPQTYAGETPTPPSLSVPVVLQPNMSSLDLICIEGIFTGAPGAFNVQIQEADTNLQTNYITPSATAYTVTAVNSNNVFRVDLSPTGGQFLAVLLSSRTNAVPFSCRITRLA